MGAHVEERVASIFEDIDPEASPHEYSVKAAQGRMTSGDQSVEDIWWKAVRNAPPSVEVVDVDEPEGEGELVRVVATEICASDLKYLRWGSTQIAGHEFAGVLPHTAGRLQLHRQTLGE
jgi:hypothetical protein